MTLAKRITKLLETAEARDIRCNVRRIVLQPGQAWMSPSGRSVYNSTHLPIRYIVDNE